MKNRWTLQIRLFTVFFFIGLFTFGGGYVMIPLISRELVRKRGWLSDEEFREAVTLGSSIPGPVGPNLAFFCGGKVVGTAGALAAYLGCVLPSFLVILGIALGLSPFFSTPLAQKFFQAAGAAVTGLIAASALRLGTQISRDIFDLFLVISSSALILGVKIHPLWALVWTMSLGLIWKRWHHAS